MLKRWASGFWLPMQPGLHYFFRRGTWWGCKMVTLPLYNPHDTLFSVPLRWSQIVHQGCFLDKKSEQGSKLLTGRGIFFWLTSTHRGVEKNDRRNRLYFQNSSAVENILAESAGGGRFLTEFITGMDLTMAPGVLLNKFKNIFSLQNNFQFMRIKNLTFSNWHKYIL